MTDSRPVYQPIHPSIRSKLDPQYAAFHDSHLQYVEPSENFKWDPEVRNKPGLPDYGSPKVDVGSTRDFEVGEFRVRAFTPEGSPTEGGWPILVWFHGGEF